MLRTVLSLVAVGALVAAGVVAAMWTGFWGQTDADKAAIAGLARIPATVGPWVGTDAPKDDPSTKRMMKVAEATDWLARTYRHTKTNEAVEVLILYGPSGPLADHTPDICNSAQGFEPIGTRELVSVPIPNGSASLWSSRFGKGGATGNGFQFQVLWAWGTDGDWMASADPHRDFVLKQRIFKIYITRTVPGSGAATAEAADPAREFLGDFLPEVKRALGPG